MVNARWWLVPFWHKGPLKAFKLATFTSRAAEKLRRQNLAAARLVVFVMTNRFRPQDPQYNREQTVELPVASSDTGRLVAAAEHGLAKIWREGFSYKKAGVMLLDLCPASTVQGGLFDDPDDPRSRARMRAIDALNARYGRNTVAMAASGVHKAWKLRNEFISQHYSTSWEGLLRV